MPKQQKRENLNLAKVLKLGYAPEKKQEKVMNKYGYKIDKPLSNDNQQVYYNPDKKKLLVNVTGTHNVSDYFTDARLALGGLKNTKRYKQAEDVLQKAKQKYNEDKVVLTGHSLGASIAKNISKPTDETYTLNAGITIGEKSRPKPNQHNYRVEGDVVSLFGTNQRHTTTIPYSYDKYDPFKAHSTDAIKDQMIFI